jgi:aldose 1-epimerase
VTLETVACCAEGGTATWGEHSTTAANIGDQACPYGTGQHPYLSPGAGLIDDCVLQLGASTRILTVNERQLPTGTAAVEGTEFDFRAGRLIGDQRLDRPFTDLDRDQNGRAWVRLIAPDGTRTEEWVDHHYPIIEIYTGDTLSPPRRRVGLGAEPMTCPPNAFQTGNGLTRLEAGQPLTTTWGARLKGN